MWRVFADQFKTHQPAPGHPVNPIRFLGTDAQNQTVGAVVNCLGALSVRDAASFWLVRSVPVRRRSDRLLCRLGDARGCTSTRLWPARRTRRSPTPKSLRCGGEGGRYKRRSRHRRTRRCICRRYHSEPNGRSDGDGRLDRNRSFGTAWAGNRPGQCHPVFRGEVWRDVRDGDKRLGNSARFGSRFWKRRGCGEAGVDSSGPLPSLARAGPAPAGPADPMHWKSELRPRRRQNNLTNHPGRPLGRARRG